VTLTRGTPCIKTSIQTKYSNHQTKYIGKYVRAKDLTAPWYYLDQYVGHLAIEPELRSQSSWNDVP